MAIRHSLLACTSTTFQGTIRILVLVPLVPPRTPVFVFYSINVMNNIVFLSIVIVVSALVTLSSIWNVIRIYYGLSKELDYSHALQDICSGSVMESYTVRERILKYMKNNKIFTTNPKIVMSAFIIPVTLFIMYVALQYDWKSVSYMSVSDKLKKLQMPTLIYFVPFMFLLGSIVMIQNFGGLIFNKTISEYSKKKETIIKYLDFLKAANASNKSPTYIEYTSFINILRKRIIHVDDLESYTDVDTIMATLTTDKLFGYIKFINISMQNISAKQLQIINMINLLRGHTSSADNWKRNTSNGKNSKPLVDMKWTSSLSPEDKILLKEAVESFDKDEVNNYEVIYALQKMANPDGPYNDYQYLYNLSYSIPASEKSVKEKEVKDALIYLSLALNGNPIEDVKARLVNVSYFVYTFIIVTSYIVIHVIYKAVPNPMSTMILGMFIFALLFIYLWVVNFMSNV